jgi:hypothetical protein
LTRRTAARLCWLSARELQLTAERRQIQLPGLMARDEFHKTAMAGPTTQLSLEHSKAVESYLVILTGQRSNQLNYVPTRQINEMRNRQCSCGVAPFA